MKTDTTEKGLESLIMRHMTGTDGLAFGTPEFVAEVEPAKGGSGWCAGSGAACGFRRPRGTATASVIRQTGTGSPRRSARNAGNPR